MLVTDIILSTEIATGHLTSAGHLIASLCLVERNLTPRTVTDNLLAQFLFAEQQKKV